ncbi:MAG: methyl-accepting chemotaxis protein [Lachnospiraceae bacterium]|nr:methyl-accepting chemotaxis protein [Lachnospiraceae bacterium]
MFGNKGVKEQLQKAEKISAQSMETLGEVTSHVADIRVEIDQLNMSASRMDHSLTKVVDCTKEARDCNEEIQDKLQDMQDMAGQVVEQGQHVAKEYKSQREFVSKQKEELSDLIEDGKNYTKLSKSISENSKKQEEQLVALMAEITSIRTVVNNIGAMALDAAIEAGRLGEQGMNFVKAAENIRQVTGEFGEKTEELQMSLQEMQQTHQMSQQDTNKFISLVKDNNKTAQNLMNAAEKNEKKEAADCEILDEYLDEIKGLQSEIVDMNDRSIKKQETILNEMESIGSCYMEQQESATKIEEALIKMKQSLENVEKEN